MKIYTKDGICYNLSMRTLIRLAIAFVNFVLWALVGVALCVMCSCTRVQYVPVETTKLDSVRVVDVQRDSVYVYDSVYVREVHDTIFITKWHTEYKEALRVDTFEVFRTDSIQNIIEVERDFTPWESICFSLGRVMLTIGAFVLVYKLYILFRKLRK